MTQPDGAASLTGKRILVVEDEAIVAMLLENILEDIGCTPVGPALTLEQAHTLSTAEEPPDAAILDVNLRGERVYPVAEVLRDRGVPIIFATGYGEGGLDSAWRGRPTVQKPYTMDDIVRTLSRVLAP
ncbi:MAG: response regulator [Alphaproteobacteria bacterium]|nr:response regulator [Alphaproteobacteria bacterium]